MARKTKPISSLEELLAALPAIFEKINADQSLTRRFLANPLLLAEDMGLTLTPEMHHFAARRMRFNAENFARLNALEAEIWTHAGEQFDLDAPEQLQRILDEKLDILRAVPSPPPTKKRGRRSKADREAEEKAAAAAAGAPKVAVTALQARVVGHGKLDDPLEALRERHPILPPLLEYRQIEASTARLAPRALYDRLAGDDVDLPFSDFKLRLKLVPKE